MNPRSCRRVTYFDRTRHFPLHVNPEVESIETTASAYTGIAVHCNVNCKCAPALTASGLWEPPCLTLHSGTPAPYLQLSSASSSSSWLMASVCLWPPLACHFQMLFRAAPGHGTIRQSVYSSGDKKTGKTLQFGYQPKCPNLIKNGAQIL